MSSARASRSRDRGAMALRTHVGAGASAGNTRKGSLGSKRPTSHERSPSGGTTSAHGELTGLARATRAVPQHHAAHGLVLRGASRGNNTGWVYWKLAFGCDGDSCPNATEFASFCDSLRIEVRQPGRDAARLL